MPATDDSAIDPVAASRRDDGGRPVPLRSDGHAHGMVDQQSDVATGAGGASA